MNTGTLEKSVPSAEALRKKRGGFFAAGVVLTALALAFLYACAVDRFHGKAAMAESNFQANLIRMGEFLHAKSRPDIVMVGSSLTARLRPEFFSAVKPANIALDGSTGRAGMRFLIETGHPVRFLLVEENFLTFQDEENGRLLLEAIKEPQMRAAKWFPFLRAAYRPSSVLYSAVKAKVDSFRNTPSVSAPLQTGQRRIGPGLAQAVEMIRSVRAKGARIVIFSLPVGGFPVFSGPNVLLQALGPDVTFIDVGAEFAAMGYVPHYSDGIHLIGPSAQVAAQVLDAALAKLVAESGTNAK